MSEWIRESQMAGSWYPDEPAELRAVLKECFRVANDTYPENPRLRCDTKSAGLMAPHAGYQFSGVTAACAYSVLGEWKPGRVVVLAPSHQEFFDHISLWHHTEGRAAWKTPLGELTVDGEFCERLLLVSDHIKAGSDGHRHEHSLELQLPFLQHLLGETKLVPLSIGHQRTELIDALVDALASCADDVPTLVIASTDLSHFHNLRDAQRLDERFLQQVEDLDHASLAREMQLRSCEACGGGGVVALMRWAQRTMNSPSATLLDYRTSASVTGETQSVVGYAAALIRDGA